MSFTSSHIQLELIRQELNDLRYIIDKLSPEQDQGLIETYMRRLQEIGYLLQDQLYQYKRRHLKLVSSPNSSTP